MSLLKRGGGGGWLGVEGERVGKEGGDVSLIRFRLLEGKPTGYSLNTVCVLLRYLAAW